MMRPRWRKVWHDLIGSLSRTLLVVVSIVVGVFSIGVITGTYVIISQDMSASYAANNPMNVELQTDDFNSSLIQTIQDMRGVKQAEGRRIFSIQARIPGTSQWLPTNMVAINNFTTQKINLMHVLSGSGRPAKNQVLLEKKVLDSLNVKVGDSLEFLLDNGNLRTLKVVGIVQDPSTGAGDFLADPYIYISTDSLSNLRQPVLYNRLYATLTTGQNDDATLNQMAAAIKDNATKSGVSVLQTNSYKSNQHPLASTVQAILGILLVLGVLILFLSSSLIANTLERAAQPAPAPHRRNEAGRRAAQPDPHDVYCAHPGLRGDRPFDCRPAGRPGRLCPRGLYRQHDQLQPARLPHYPAGFRHPDCGRPGRATAGRSRPGAERVTDHRVARPQWRYAPGAKETPPAGQTAQSRLSSVSKSGSPPGFPGAGCISHAHC